MNTSDLLSKIDQLEKQLEIETTALKIAVTEMWISNNWCGEWIGIGTPLIYPRDGLIIYREKAKDILKI